MDLENLTLEQTRKAIKEEWHCNLGDGMKAMLLGLVDRLELSESNLAAMESQDPAGKVVKWLNSNTAICSGEGLATAAIDADIFFKPVPADKPAVEQRCAECGRVDAGTALYCVKCWDSEQVPAVGVPESFLKLYDHARGMRFGTDWNNGTAARHNRQPLIDAIWECEKWLAAAPSHSQQYSLSDALADMRATMRYIDEDEPDLDVIRGEIGEMILRLTLKYGCGGPEPDRCPSHKSEHEWDENNNCTVCGVNQLSRRTACPNHESELSASPAPDDIDRLVEHAAVLSIGLRDNDTDLPTESWRSLPDHLQKAINEKTEVLDFANSEFDVGN